VRLLSKPENQRFSPESVTHRSDPAHDSAQDLQENTSNVDEVAVPSQTTNTDISESGMRKENNLLTNLCF